MDDKRLEESYFFLGLTPEASMREVEKAFRDLCELYGEESLATYSLLEYADRQEKLEALQTAYDRILQDRLHAPAPGHGGAVVVVDEQHLVDESCIVCIDADPQEAPGQFLRQMREAQGLSLHDVAERTKIGSFQLQGIEEQRFDVLPAPVYLRGFLKEFARVVEIPDAEELIESFLHLYQGDKEG